MRNKQCLFMRSSAALVYNCKLALYSLARALRRRKFVQTRAECKLVYIMPSATEFRNIQSFSFPKEYRACEVYLELAEDGGV